VLAAAAAVGRPAALGAAQAAGAAPGIGELDARHFPGFTASRVETSGATIHTLVGGAGAPVLLMHGAPLTHLSWRAVARELAREYTVVATDLRGYGDSSKPPDGENHANHAKRAMALDQVEVMRHLGFERFAVVGHDRGARVAQRLVLDHPDRVTKVAVLDIVPTHYLYSHITMEFVRVYPHWFLYIQPAPIPENVLLEQNAARAGRALSDVQADYARRYLDPATVHGMCEDYRAGASIDLEHDEADRRQGRRIACPLLALWGEQAPMGRMYNFPTIWREYATDVAARGVAAGHNLQEQAPELTLAELQLFLKG
jgi:haloacetate dehalogenase